MKRAFMCFVICIVFFMATGCAAEAKSPGTKEKTDITDKKYIVKGEGYTF
ncbi:MAG: hypothetical protein ACOZCL_03800 [Bacillota bacterium]